MAGVVSLSGSRFVDFFLACVSVSARQSRAQCRAREFRRKVLFLGSCELTAHQCPPAGAASRQKSALAARCGPLTLGAALANVAGLAGAALTTDRVNTWRKGRC